MKRIFAKCFLQKQTQNTKTVDKPQLDAKETIREEVVEVRSSPNEEHKFDLHTNHVHHCNTKKTKDAKEQSLSNHAKEQSLHEIEQNATKNNNEGSASKTESKRSSQNLQRKKILDCQKPMLRSFKPDLLPPGSPARKRVRSSRSSSKTLSFICLDTDDHSDDEIADPLVLQGITIQCYNFISFLYD